MRIVTGKERIGLKVLFLWNGIAFTGVISSITERTCGIISDTNVYATDRLMIPRLGNELYIHKDKCMITGEVIPVTHEVETVMVDPKYHSVESAYYSLPKYNVLSTDRNCEMGHNIKFNINHIFYMNDGRYYKICDSVMSGILQDINNKNHFVKANWIFQGKINMHNPRDYEVYDENNIERVLYVPYNYRRNSVETPFDSVVKHGLYDVVYNKEKRSQPHQRFFRPERKDDIGIKNIPKNYKFPEDSFKY